MLVYDLADPVELQGYVREAADEANRNRFILSQFLANDPIDDIEYRATRGTLADQDVAYVRAWDTESPIAKRQGVSRMMGELPPISLKIPVTEEQRLRRRALERQSNDPIIAKIFDDAGNLARSVAARVELMRGEALETGQIALNENGVVQTIDFERSNTHEPAALTSTAKWDAPTTATPIEDMTGWQETYYNTNGVYPALQLTSLKVINYLLRNAEIRALAQSLNGTPSIVTRQTLASILVAYDLPPMVAYDVKVRVAGSQVRVISEDKVIMLPPAGEPLGKTFLGTTAESIELAEARQISQDDLPGMTGVVEKTFDPVSTWTKVSAVALPVMINPDLTLVADVI